VFLSAAVSTTWLLRVPFLQQTDEQAHADYVYALYDSGGWFAAPNARAEDYVTQQVRYLVGRTNFWDMRVSKQGRAPHGYGSQTYFTDLDRGAPKSVATHRSLAPTAVPYVAFGYPVGYYEVAAIVMRVAATVSQGSVVATYFAARALGVVCLTFSILLTFMTLRALRYNEQHALWLTLAIGIMPLASWVSSYIQPDTFVFLLTTLTIYLSVCWRQQPFEPKRSAMLLGTLVAIFFVKQHYGLVATIAVAFMVCSHLPMKRSLTGKRTLRIAACAALLGAAWVAATTLTPVGSLRVPPALSAIHVQASPFAQSVMQVVHLLLIGIGDIYLMGNACYTFWLSYGDNVTPYIQWDAPSRAVQLITAITSATVAILLALSQLRVVRRINKIFRHHPSIAIQLTFGDVILNLYVLWLLFLLLIYISSAGQVSIEGRYFLPVLLPTVFLTVKYLPRPFNRSNRNRISTVSTVCWVAYSAIMGVLALWSMQHQFYSEPRDIALSRFVIITEAAAGGTPSLDPRILRLLPLQSGLIGGLAASTKYSSPLRGIDATLDARPIPVFYSYKRSAYYGVAIDKFVIQTPSDLVPGRHVLLIAPRPATRRDAKASLEIDVAG